MAPHQPTIELLAPAGNFEKLEIAVHYGADAVYLGGKDFSLRNFSGNFTLPELDRAVRFAHSRNVRVYVACNVYPRNDELSDFSDFLKRLGEIGPDALILSDPGVILTAREILPDMAIHLSTQANTTNHRAATFWKTLGVTRINAARELPLTDIRQIVKKSGMEVEAFVHGAMCIAYSGRCLLSSYLTGRDSNRGACAHPCRWRYHVVEETRPGKFMPIAEDSRGSYIFASRDLCMIEHIPEMIDSGLCALKIEGRMKGINYLASTVKVYRQAIDACLADPEGYTVRPEWLEEIEGINNRGFCTGFYLNDPEAPVPLYTAHEPSMERTFLAKILAGENGGAIQLDVRNKLVKGEMIEIFSPCSPLRRAVVCEMYDAAGKAIIEANPGNTVTIRLSEAGGKPNDLIRRVPANRPQGQPSNTQSPTLIR